MRQCTILELDRGTTQNVSSESAAGADMPRSVDTDLVMQVILAFLAVMYAALAANCLCAPCFAVTLRPSSGAAVSDSKKYVYREEQNDPSPEIYIHGRNTYHSDADSRYGIDDRLLGGK